MVPTLLVLDVGFGLDDRKEPCFVEGEEVVSRAEGWSGFRSVSFGVRLDLA